MYIVQYILQKNIYELVTGRTRKNRTLYFSGTEKYAGRTLAKTRTSNFPSEPPKKAEHPTLIDVEADDQYLQLSEYTKVHYQYAYRKHLLCGSYMYNQSKKSWKRSKHGKS